LLTPKQPHYAKMCVPAAACIHARLIACQTSCRQRHPLEEYS
jgi:hypothetical protein